MCYIAIILVNLNLHSRLTSHWLVFSLLLAIVLLATYTVVGDRGVFHLWRLRSEKAALDERNFRLQKDNEALRQRIAQVRNNNFYLEKLAREELNLVRPGEVIYRFPSSEPQSENRGSLPEPAAPARSAAGAKSR